MPVDMARILGSIPIYGSPYLEMLVRICQEAAHGRSNASLPLPVLSYQFSPWHNHFTGGSDACSTAGEIKEIAGYHSDLNGLKQELDTANAVVPPGPSGEGIRLSFIALDPKRFSWQPQRGDRDNWTGGHVACVQHKNELAYNVTKEAFPDAVVQFYNNGAAHYSPAGCGYWNCTDAPWDRPA